MATGDNSVADDIARVLTGRKDGSFKAKMPTDNALGDAAGAILGAPFAPERQGARRVIGTANLLFEKDANTLGFDPGDGQQAGHGRGRPPISGRSTGRSAAARSTACSMAAWRR
jgi:hypothetical protein